MKFLKPLTVAALAIPLALTGCVTDPVSGQRNTSKTAMYGLGGAAVCGIVGALTHGGKGARNSALACGAIGAGVGGYMDYQEKKTARKPEKHQHRSGTPRQPNQAGDA